MADVRDNRSQIQGTRAHDEAEAGSVGDRPVKIGGKAATSLPSSVSAGDRVDAYFDENGRMVVVVGVSALPTGAATAANQTTIIGHLDGVETQLFDIEGVLTTIDADTGNIVTRITSISGAVTTDDAAVNLGVINVNMCGFVFDDAATDSIDEGDAGAARMSANRNQYIQIRDGAGNERGANVNASNQLSVSVDNTVTVGSHAVTNAGTFAVQNAALATVTGQDLHFDSDGDNTAQTIKASSGRLYFLEVSNPNSADAYLQLYDESGAITVGTTTPKQSYLVPAGDGTKDGAMDKFFDPPLAFANTIKYACTTTATGNGDPTTGLIVNAGYK